MQTGTRITAWSFWRSWTPMKMVGILKCWIFVRRNIRSLEKSFKSCFQGRCFVLSLIMSQDSCHLKVTLDVTALSPERSNTLENFSVTESDGETSLWLVACVRCGVHEDLNVSTLLLQPSLWPTIGNSATNEPVNYERFYRNHESTKMMTLWWQKTRTRQQFFPVSHYFYGKLK